MEFRRSADAYRDDNFWLDPVMEHPKAGDKMPKLPAMVGGADCEYFKFLTVYSGLSDG